MSRTEAIDFLATGKCWVCRGNGLHISLETTVEGEPIGREEGKELLDKLVRAPVWQQLQLQASIPNVDHAVEKAQHKKRTVQINLAHAREDTDSATSRHRLFPNVSSADVRPPQDVPVFGLDSVSLQMDIVAMRSRSGPTKQGSWHDIIEPNNDINHTRGSSVNEAECIDESGILFDESSGTKGRLSEHQTVEAAIPDTNIAIRKRKRFCTYPDAHDYNTGTAVDQSPVNRRVRRTTIIPTVTENTLNSSESKSCEFEKLIESAIRVAVCKGTPRLIAGVRTLTSTFTVNLSAIAPSLWLPGYLPALSQRAHLIPTIGRSLGQAAGTNAQSPSLKAKIAELAATGEGDNMQIYSKADRDRPLIRGLETRLWSNAQSQLVNAGKGPLQSFLAAPMELLEPLDAHESLLDNDPEHVAILDPQCLDRYSGSHPSPPYLQHLVGERMGANSNYGAESIQDDLLFSTNLAMSASAEFASYKHTSLTMTGNSISDDSGLAHTQEPPRRSRNEVAIRAQSETLFSMDDCENVILFDKNWGLNYESIKRT